jgi:predicted nuclease with TOPRIM domain
MPGNHSVGANSQTPENVSAQLRAAEERIKELEAKVRRLENKLDRAERWVYKIWVEIEQKFFGGDAAYSQPPYIGITHPEG